MTTVRYLGHSVFAFEHEGKTARTGAHEPVDVAKDERQSGRGGNRGGRRGHERP